MVRLGCRPISYIFFAARALHLPGSRLYNYTRVSHSLLGAGLHAGITRLTRTLH